MKFKDFIKLYVGNEYHVRTRHNDGYLMVNNRLDKDKPQVKELNELEVLDFDLRSDLWGHKIILITLD